MNSNTKTIQNKRAAKAQKRIDLYGGKTPDSNHADWARYYLHLFHGGKDVLGLDHLTPGTGYKVGRGVGRNAGDRAEDRLQAAENNVKCMMEKPVDQMSIIDRIIEMDKP